MENLFRLDSRFSKLMTKLFDAWLLNLLWLVCCIPIFTVGPATQALYYVALKQSEGEDGYVIRQYFTAFRRSFKQSVGIGLIMLGTGAILLLNIYTAHITTVTWFHGLLPVFLILLFGWACIVVYVFAIQARFYNTVKDTFKIAAGLSIEHFGKTMLMLVTSLVLAGLIYFVPILLFIDVGLIPMANARLLRNVFAAHLEDDTCEQRESS